jgi:hypothetical protein
MTPPVVPYLGKVAIEVERLIEDDAAGVAFNLDDDSRSGLRAASMPR